MTRAYCFAALLGTFLVPGPLLAEGTGKITGLSLYSDQCVETLKEALSKVEGVSEIKVDLKSRTAAFKLKDEEATNRLYIAVAKAGFHGNYDIAKSVAIKGFIPVAEPIVSRDEFAEIKFKNMHVCCTECEKVIAGLFKDAKVEFSGKGPLKEVKITGRKLTLAKIMEPLRSAGFRVVLAD
jgi:copper chaperone CopZ